MKGDSLSENSVHGEDRKILDYHGINERNKIDGKFLQLFLSAYNFLTIEVFL